jgi:hypothetical protein
MFSPFLGICAPPFHQKKYPFQRYNAAPEPLVLSIIKESGRRNPPLRFAFLKFFHLFRKKRLTFANIWRIINVLIMDVGCNLASQKCISTKTQGDSDAYNPIYARDHEKDHQPVELMVFKVFTARRL